MGKEELGREDGQKYRNMGAETGEEGQARGAWSD
jgi:hypothetical protein